MTRFAVAAALVARLGLMTLDAQTRIVTNDAGPYLKRLFPQAGTFSRHKGTPLHDKANGVDPRINAGAQPIGLIFWTTDLVPNTYAYHGTIPTLVGMNMTGVWRGVINFNSEPYGYFPVNPPQVAAQFTGKSICAPFRLGEDAHAISRATIIVSSATRAIRDSARAMARRFLIPATVME